MSSRFAGVFSASTFPPASDNAHSVDFDVHALIAGAFYTGILSLAAVFGRNLTLLQMHEYHPLKLQFPSVPFFSDAGGLLVIRPVLSN